MYRSQKERVLDYLKQYGKITSLECYDKLRIVDLQHAIYELRKEEYNITDRWVKGNDTRTQYKEYRLEN